jgi:hypothetical protein
MRAGAWLLVLLIAASTAGCKKKIDLTQGVQVVDVVTGWSDAGVVDGQNKIVPSVSFKFKNVSGEPLDTLQANVLFRRANEEGEWGSNFVRVTGTEGLAPNATSAAQHVNSPKGYTGTETRQQMLQNSQFVDARVQIFAKYSSTQWQPVGEFIVDRRLLAN